MANDRISQLPVQVVVAPTDAAARLSSQAVQVVVAPTDAELRLSTLAVQVVYPSSNPTTPVAAGRSYAIIIG
jgi:hypothetical protein